VSLSPPRKRDGMEIAEAAGGFVVHDTEGGRVHYLNHTAALIYELCDGGTPVDEIARLLGEAYGPQPALDEQVQLYVARLRDEKLVI
jgi:hypothetical protein